MSTSNPRQDIPLLLEQGATEEVTELIQILQPYDLAECYVDIPEVLRTSFLDLLTPWQLTALVQELDYTEQRRIFERLGLERSSAVMDMMENDDLADLLANMSSREIKSFLSSMKKEESLQVQRLLKYAPETAGGIMTNRFVWVHTQDTVREAVGKIKNFAEYAQNIYYLYILDNEKKLVGVATYRDLVLAGPDDRMEAIMHERVISVPVDMDQEEVARTIERYDFIAVPVVDEQQRLIGMITVDDIIDVIVDEANEDIERLNATGKGVDIKTGAWTATIRRLPWLILLLFLGFASGGVISMFESTLHQVVALAFFMPMIAGMTGNTGTQSLAIVVRGLASAAITSQDISRLLFREFKVGLLIGSACGISVAIITFLWQWSFTLSLVIGCSLFLTLIIGTLAGTIIPLLLYRLKIDPAIASGPLITTLNDIFSLLIYFGLATLFISQL
jgi:magnesium transporter